MEGRIGQLSRVCFLMASRLWSRKQGYQWWHTIGGGAYNTSHVSIPANFVNIVITCTFVAVQYVPVLCPKPCPYHRVGRLYK